MRILVNFFPSSSKKLGRSLANSLKSILVTFVHRSHPMLYADIFFGIRGLELFM